MSQEFGFFVGVALMIIGIGLSVRACRSDCKATCDPAAVQVDAAGFYCSCKETTP